MRIPFHFDAATTGISDMWLCVWKLIGQNTEASVVHFVEISSLFILLTKQQNVSLLFSVVRLHLAKQNYPFGHTQLIDRRLSRAGLDCMYIQQKIRVIIGEVGKFA